MTKKLFLLMIALLIILLIMISRILWQNRNVEISLKKESTVVKKDSSPIVNKKEATEIKYDTSTASSLTFVVNKKHPLPADYVPSDLVKIPVSTNGKIEKLRKEAADQLILLFQAAKQAGLRLRLGSGYRSYSYQVSLYNAYCQQIGQSETDKVSARPGYSEHQTGLAADILGADVNFDFSKRFETQKEAIWLKKHAAEYGFVLRFIKGKEKITGYSFEPWHFRYLGKEVAQKIVKQGEDVTLEEFFHVEGGDYVQ